MTSRDYFGDGAADKLAKEAVKALPPGCTPVPE
jgi:hypothetical protein